MNDAPAENPSPADSLEEFDATQLARLVAGATDEQLAEGMSDLEARERTLGEIFRRMAEHADPAKAKGNDAVIHWKILDRPGGGYDHYEVVLQGGECTVSDQPSGEPRVTFKIGPVDFLRLVSGNANGPMLFMTGKLKIEGDLMFASTMTSLFRIPSASGPAAGAGAETARAGGPAAGATDTGGGEPSGAGTGEAP
jgi:putative sterol carrier protein